jgi:hypothetical protein
MIFRLAKVILICLAITGLAESISGQERGPAAVQMEAMKKLSFLVGEWQGEGWAEFVPGQRRTSPVREVVQSKLGGMVLLVEGLGKTKVAGKQEEVVVHNAIGLISYDADARLYRVKSHLANGRSVEAEASFVDGGFQWRFKTPQGLGIRYTVKLTEKGEWFEKGDISQDGQSWRQFHEMTLQKLK